MTEVTVNVNATVVVIGMERIPIDDALDRLLDSCTVALQEFTTEELRAMADRRDEVYKGGWMQTMIREYVEVWR